MITAVVKLSGCASGRLDKFYIWEFPTQRTCSLNLRVEDPRGGSSY